MHARRRPGSLRLRANHPNWTYLAVTIGDQPALVGVEVGNHVEGVGLGGLVGVRQHSPQGLLGELVVGVVDEGKGEAVELLLAVMQENLWVLRFRW